MFGSARIVCFPSKVESATDWAGRAWERATRSGGKGIFPKRVSVWWLTPPTLLLRGGAVAQLQLRFRDLSNAWWCIGSVHPFQKKEWYNVHVPSVFDVRVPTVTPVNKTAGQSKWFDALTCFRAVR